VTLKNNGWMSGMPGLSGELQATCPRIAARRTHFSKISCRASAAGSEIQSPSVAALAANCLALKQFMEAGRK